MTNYEEFVRERITELRLRKGISEYQLSYELGRSRSFIYNISSGKSLPPLRMLLAICEYFGITPSEFFNDKSSNPELIHKAVEGLQELNDDDILLVLNLVNRLKKHNP